MANIIEINHEIGNTSEYGTIYDPDTGEFNVTEAAALGGTNCGLAITINDTDNVYGQVTLGSPNASGIWRARFYLDPNSITWANNTDTEILVLQGGATEWGEVLIIKFGKDGSGNYIIHSMTQPDVGGYDDSGNHIITDAPHWIEIEVSAGAGTGTHKLWIDSLIAPMYSKAALDNNSKAVNMQYCYFGAFGGVPAGADGIIFLDELIVNDTGDEIGPLDSLIGTKQYMPTFYRG